MSIGRTTRRKSKPTLLGPWGTAVVFFLILGVTYGERTHRRRRKSWPYGLRLESAEGVFLLDAAALPENAGRVAPGFVAYWFDRRAESVYVYDTLIFERTEAAPALTALERRLGVAVGELTKDIAWLRDPSERGDEANLAPGDWMPASKPAILRTMGFRPQRSAIRAEPIRIDANVIAAACPPPMAAVPPGDSRPAPFESAQAEATWRIGQVLVALAGCNDGGGDGDGGDSGGDPPCGLVCCGSCCNDPCCQTGCCGACCNNPCCGDPCCTNPCCGDPCCNNRCCQGDPCCGSPDPCCNPSDPCCGNPDRCCNPDNPCCGSSDPCCNYNDPCCGNPDACCNSDNPCCAGAGIGDSENDSPAALVVGGQSEPCCDDNDPCCNVSCTDNDPCTDDSCSGGECFNDPKCPGPCCEGECCPPGQSCCAGTCCPSALCCVVTCCADGYACCSPCPTCQPMCVAENRCCNGELLLVDQVCCNGVPCHVSRCCENGECCDQACEACLDNGALTGGSATVEQTPVCVGDSLTFTADGVVDSGGVKRVSCSGKQLIPPVAPGYTWTITKPDGTQVNGSSASASVATTLPGAYSCVFKANAARECPPGELQLPAKTGKAVELHPLLVIFSGAQRYTVNQDNGVGAYPVLHWRDNSTPRDDDNDDVGDHNIPVAYVRGSTMVLAAQFQVVPTDGFSGLSVTVTGDAAGGGGTYQFTKSLTPTGTLTIAGVSANAPLPNNIDYLDPLSISWSITPAGGQPLTCIAPTNHRIYVLLGVPNTNARYETLFHIGCTNAPGMDTESAATAAIWSEFTDLVVRRKPIDGFNNPDNARLTYYANWACVNTETAQVLAASDGQCGAWAHLFIDMMGAQGINHTNEHIVFFPDQMQIPGAQGFIVSNWSHATGNGRSGDPAFPYLNVYRGAYVAANQFSWLFAEVNDQAGVAGQGNANPNSLFGNHQVVKFGAPAMYYDPSYGITFGSLTDIDASAIAGYVKSNTLTLNEPDFGVDFNGNGNSTDVGVQVDALLFQKNPSGNQLAEVAIEYP